jgi:GT2 family glycosyltransferase
MRGQGRRKWGRNGPAEEVLDQSAQNATVFVIVPTFNRWTYTRACMDQLLAQTHAPLAILVSDGGSTDGTREALARDYPSVHVLHDDKERWWAGSTALAVTKACELGRDGDFVLLLNNDTVIPQDYVETLVRVSLRENAAVGAKIVDSRDHGLVLDAGEYITWETYEFPVKTQIAPGETFCDDVDVLPGRGSLIPLAMLRSIGNVDDAAFPHYLADYDLFCRLKAAGHRLGVTYETAILAHIEETGIIPSVGKSSFRAVWNELFARRSMTNMRDHWRFVSRHAPEHLRARSRRSIIRRGMHRILYGSPLAAVTRPLLAVYVYLRSIAGVSRRLWVERDDPDSRFLALQLPPPIPKVVQILALPRPLSVGEIAALGFDPEKLQADGVLDDTPAPGWLRVTTLNGADPRAPEAISRLARIAVPMSLDKITQLRAYRSAKTAHAIGAGASSPDPAPSSTPLKKP